MYQSKWLIVFLIVSLSLVMPVFCIAEEKASEMNTPASPDDAEPGDSVRNEKAGQETPPVIDTAIGTADFIDYAYPLNLAGLRIFMMDIQYSDPEIFLKLHTDYKALEDKNRLVLSFTVLTVGGGNLLAAGTLAFYMASVVAAALANAVGDFLSSCGPGPRTWRPQYIPEFGIGYATSLVTGIGLILTGGLFAIACHVNERDVGAVFNKYIVIKYPSD